MKFRLGGGAFAAIGIAVLVTVIAALRWLGQNAAAIGRGVGSLFQVLALVSVLAGAAAAGRMIWQARQRARAAPAETPDAPAPIRVPSEQVPLGRAGQPAALPPGGTHYHFGEMDEEQAARLVRLIRGDDHDE